MKKRQKLVDQLNNPKIDQFVFLLSSKGNPICDIVSFLTPQHTHLTAHHVTLAQPADVASI